MPRRTIPWALFVGGSHGGVLLHHRNRGRAGGAAIDGSQQPAGTGAGHREDASSAWDIYWMLPLAAFLIALSNVGAAGAYLAAVARLAIRCRHRPFSAAGVWQRCIRAGKRRGSRLLTQYFVGVLFIFLGQAGTSVKGAYDVLVSMGVITYFIPYLYCLPP